MGYKIVWHPKAIDDLGEIEEEERKKIIKKIEFLAKLPLELGEPLRGELKGIFRYRVGKYRILYVVKPSEEILVIVAVGKRNEIYKRKI